MNYKANAFELAMIHIAGAILLVALVYIHFQPQIENRFYNKYESYAEDIIQEMECVEEHVKELFDKVNSSTDSIIVLDQTTGALRLEKIKLD